jgi:Kef-type K+ transport system membrane component KefB
MEHLWIYTSIILAIVVVAKIISTKTKSVDVLWLIIFGAVAVNIGILPHESEILEAIGDWGIVFVMFALGFEENVTNFMKGLKRSWGIAIIGAFFPFLAGYYSATIFGYSFNVAMIWGLTMTATAVSLTMVSLKSEGLQTSHAATGIMTAAVVDDILSLIGLSILIPIALTTQNDTNAVIDIGAIVFILFKVILFFFIIIFIGTVLFPDTLANEKDKRHSFLFKIAVIIRKYFGIRKLLIVYNGRFTPLVMIFIAMTFGAIANNMGFHPAIGAYFAGLFLKEEYFQCTVDRQLLNHKKDAEFVINHLAFSIFGPIFFVMLGTKLIFDTKIIIEIMPIALILFTSVLVLQILSAGLAARYTGRYAWHESVMIGFGMLGRAELAFIVIDIAFVENHLINIEQFYSLMITIFLLNIAVPLLIKWWKPYYQGDKEFVLFGSKLSR